MDKLINRYRSQLSGIATLGVLFVHSKNVIILPEVISALFSYGGIGVYIFVFLSSIGLYNSLKSRGGGYKKSEFYTRRFQRVFVPYLLVAATWYGIKYLLIQYDAEGFIYELSTLSFWLDHQGSWYVAMLVPVYLIFPLFYDWVENSHSHSQNKLTRSTKIIVAGVVASTVAFTISILDPQLYNHLSQVFSSVIIYVIGYYVADKVMDGRYNGYLFSIICVAFYVVRAATPLAAFHFFNAISWSLLAIPIITVSAWFLSKIKSRFIDSILGFFFFFSLELYLWNIFLIQAIRYFGVIDWLEKHGDSSGYVAYGLVVVGGIILSVVYGKLSGAIVQKMNLKS